ncbi:hypothetical protein EZJ49_13790 [Bdellovibrio bacteriovorus]|uniref:hypothetical protein n=1 Tax=Bdellovibrio bacteriovorus TaxID=959 RepID=UPI0021D39C47|nr:hypothetical protein [Bdellovibrio bacteriovorus]UXR64134.1 hypothetical protein EZJ49_13790 [Bdellovibrio bacteriovorus]
MKALSCFLALSFISSAAFAQSLPVGLYEGMMANTGVATTRSKAASYYNPSLLRQRQDNAFSLNGNSIGSINSKSDGSTFSSSMGLAPSYLSNLVVGDSLIHEFFVANTLQGLFAWQSNQGENSFDAEANINRMVSGYSMAFKSIPFAIQFLARYSEVKTFGVNESAYPSQDIYVVSRTKSEYKNLNVALGLSTHFQFDHYTLGVNFNSRGWSLYNHNKGSAKVFTHGSPNPGDFTVTEDDSARSTVTNEEGKLLVGHGFKVGHHEFLTDSVFVEESGSLNSYTFSQSFGYRYGASDGHQLLCGLSHRFGADVDYFGQNFNTSVGYSWKTRALRSAIGFYYGRENTTIESSTVGVVFGSEYEY